MAATFLEYCNSLVILFSLGGAIYFSESYPSRRYHVWALFGFLYTFFQASLLYTVYPLSWMPAGVGQLFGISCVVLLFSLAAASLYTPLGYFWKTISRSWTTLLLFSLSLGLIDILRSVVFSILFYGKGGSIGMHFDVTSIGHALSITPFIEYAYFGGTYILTVLVGAIIYGGMYYKKIRHIYVLPIILFVGWIYIHYCIPIATPETPVHIALITTNFKDEENEEVAQEKRKELFRQLEEATYSFATSSPDILVYPEDSRFLRYLNETTLQTLQNTFPESLFIDGDTRAFNERAANFTLFYETKGFDEGNNNESLSGRPKILLFPFSEYIPSLFSPFLPFFMSTAQLTQYKNNHTYSRASALGVSPFKKVNIATLICSELFSYSTVRKLQHEKPDIVLFQSNLQVFHNRAFFSMHMRAFIKISAATLRAPIIQSANGTDSYIVSPYGTIQISLPKNSTTTKVLLQSDGSILLSQ